MSYVIDMRHYAGLDEMVGDEFEPARRFAAFLGTIVGVGSSIREEVEMPTGLACRRRPSRRPCSGLLSICRTQFPEVVWQCPACGDRGVIYGWEESIWDLSPGYALDGDEIDVELDLDQYRMLLKLPGLYGGLQWAIFSARLIRGRLVMKAGELDLEELLGRLAHEADQAKDARRQRSLQGVIGAVQAVQVVWEEDLPVYEEEESMDIPPPESAVHLHMDDYPQTLRLLLNLLDGRTDNDSLGFYPSDAGAYVDWERLTTAPLSSTQIGIVHIARGCAVLERSGGGPPNLRELVAAIVGSVV